MIHKITLDWNRHCLHEAATWLLDRAADSSDPLDLASATVVVPGSRAGRRLLEILVEQSVGRSLTPPRIITTRLLPGRLHTPRQRVASELASCLIRAQAIADMAAANPAKLGVLLPHPPRKDDPLALLAIAQEFDDIARELAEHQLTFDLVAQRCASLVDFDDSPRWQVLAAIQERYQQLLTDRDLVNEYDAVNEALAERQLSHPGAIVLVAVTEMSPLQQALLREIDGPVHVLVHAPASHARGFNDLGVLEVGYWESQTTHLKEEQVHIVDQPVDQSYMALQRIQAMQPLPSADQITVGLGDPVLGPLLARTLETVGVPSRLVAGRTIRQTPPAVVLEHIANLLSKKTTKQLAQALRCVPIEQTVRQALGTQGQQMLRSLDQYIQDHLPHALSGNWRGEGDARDVVAKAHDTLMGMMPAGWDQPQPLSQWRLPIAQLLETFFGQRPLKRFDPGDAQLIRSLQIIADALGEQSLAPDDLPVLGQCTLVEAIRLLLMQIAGQLIPPEAGSAAVELLGWLELQLDDAPHLVITGFNEGKVPQNLNNHWLLPDALRTGLGLVNNRQRLARDLYMLQAMQHSRPGLQIILGKTSSKGDPLAPSRLLLACPPDQLPAWVLKFYRDDQDHSQAPLFLTPGKTSEFTVPRPQPLDQPLSRLKVTAFKDYIACPYRFYLRHVLKLKPLDDRVSELEPMAFGILAHRVMQHFGQSQVANSTDPQVIEAWLTDQLDAQLQQMLGDQPPAAVIIQKEMLRQRLARFARVQAHEAQQGWVIQQAMVEEDLRLQMELDGQPFRIEGKLDRCDRHSHLGYRLLDYKTSDSARPASASRLKSGEWVDLQLPLYHFMARDKLQTDQMTLGYVHLPKTIKDVKFAMADWTPQDLQTAMDKAQEIIRDIRQEKFWPPKKPIYEDEFTAICMDNCRQSNQENASETAAETSPSPKGGES